MTVGSRAEVFHGTADKTSGGLVKKDLMMKDGRIVSKAASKASKKALKSNPKFMAFIADTNASKLPDSPFASRSDAHRDKSIPSERKRCFRELANPTTRRSMALSANKSSWAF